MNSLISGITFSTSKNYHFWYLIVFSLVGCHSNLIVDINNSFLTSEIQFLLVKTFIFNISNHMVTSTDVYSWYQQFNCWYQELISWEWIKVKTACHIIVMFLSAVWTHSDGTHSLQSIYYWDWCRDTLLQIWWRHKLILILEGLKVRTLSANVYFWVNYSFNGTILKICVIFYFFM